MKGGRLEGIHVVFFREFDALVARPKGRVRQQTNTRIIDHFVVARESATARGPNTGWLILMKYSKLKYLWLSQHMSLKLVIKLDPV